MPHRRGELPRFLSMLRPQQVRVALAVHIADVPGPAFPCRVSRRAHVCPDLRRSRQAPPWTTRAARTLPRPIRQRQQIRPTSRCSAAQPGGPCAPDKIQDRVRRRVVRPLWPPHVFPLARRQSHIGRARSLKGGRIPKPASLGSFPRLGGLQRTANRTRRTSPALACTLDSTQLHAGTPARLSLCPKYP